MIFKCKMCGGALDVAAGASIAECPYCGAKQTLPKLDDEKRANLYDRAGHFRRMSDFDKAMALYEEILREDGTDAEAYWSIVLCRYGIEYVEDPATHRRIPTVNRAQLTSILADEDYKAALTYADGHQRELYEAEAKEIENIQKGILAISEREAPFDVFICYKETDERGVRTRDSVLANDLYYELTNEGYKVFFSRITLEDKLGTAYEPYIFAALRSAPVMVVVGTKPEYLNAPWVKNEWSRYLALIRGGAKKTLIPAYRDMDPYDLPDAFSHLQAQDMSKLGFMQDLLRGIKKLVGADERRMAPAATPAAPAMPAAAPVQSLQSLIKRAWLFLEDGDFASVNAYCEKVLDADPEYSEAYFLKLLAQTESRNIKQLLRYPYPIRGNANFQKAVRFANPEQRQVLEGYATSIDQWVAACEAESAKRRQRINRRRLIIALILVSAIALVFICYAVNCYINTPVVINSVTYTRADDHYVVSHYGSNPETDVTILSECRGKPVTEIKSYAFRNNTSVTSVTIPNSVTTIGDSAFDGCSNLTEITIPQSVTNIGDYAFAGCTKLQKAVIGNGVKTIGTEAFYGCNKLTTVHLGYSVETISASAFRWCSSLSSITIPSSVKLIGPNAFADCTKLTGVVFATSQGWYTTQYLSATSGTNLSYLSNAANNANYLTNTYVQCYWKRK